MLSLQGLYDLDIFSIKQEKVCLFDRLNHCKTDGGKEALKELCPINKVTFEGIIQRQEAVKYIAETLQLWQFPITKSEIFYNNQYLASNYSFITRTDKIYRRLQSFNKLLINKSQYYFVLSGVRQALDIIEKINQLYRGVYNSNMPPLLKYYLRRIYECLNCLNIHEKTFDQFKNYEPPAGLLFEIDEKIRSSKKDDFQLLINIYYDLEALYSLAATHVSLYLVFPVITSHGNSFSFMDLKHLLVTNCLANSMTMRADKNILIITGPNMAGKSTFMKSIGMAFYMAHLGVGIAASEAIIPFTDQIITSINNEDDLSKGDSYFYSEVQNVKKNATSLSYYPRVLVIADELFKGTNIKDAYDCSELVLEGFLKHPSHLFILSTHIVELAEKFTNTKQCSFGCFEGILSDNQLSFNYDLKQGLSTQRLGLYILMQENIRELLESQMDI